MLCAVCMLQPVLDWIFPRLGGVHRSHFPGPPSGITAGRNAGADRAGRGLGGGTLAKRGQRLGKGLLCGSSALGRSGAARGPARAPWLDTVSNMRRKAGVWLGWRRVRGGRAAFRGGRTFVSGEEPGVRY